MFRVFFILGLILACASCTGPSGSEKFDYGPFQLHASDGWRKVTIEGFDSYVGGLTNGKDTLIFDYGWYSNDLSYVDPENHLFSIDTINGKLATLIKPREPGNGVIGLYIANAFNENRFNLIGRDIQDESEILQIFKSIRFMDSDTALNSQNFAHGFSLDRSPFFAQQYFRSNCSACHHLSNRRSIGPGLGNLDEARFNQWFLDSNYVYASQNQKYESGTQYHRKLIESLSPQEVFLIRTFFNDKK
ncbi:hypothetical protein KFE98_20775 [bacterium SCSIO 12741]|nr:hypothetical protein KFE98_20775 [bacterium SCSIO 12741]